MSYVIRWLRGWEGASEAAFCIRLALASTDGPDCKPRHRVGPQADRKRRGFGSQMATRSRTSEVASLTSYVCKMKRQHGVDCIRIDGCQRGRDSRCPCKSQLDISSSPVFVQIQTLKVHVSQRARRQYDSSEAPPRVFSFTPQTSRDGKIRICFSLSRAMPEDPEVIVACIDCL